MPRSTRDSDELRRAERTLLKWLLVAVGVVTIVCSVRYSMLSKFASVPDITRRWAGYFRNPIGGMLAGRRRVELTGYLNAPATLYYNRGPVELPAGKINHFIQEAEAWSSGCDLEYVPGTLRDPRTVTSGSLSFRVIIGLCPDWKYAPSFAGGPEPLHYTGRWVFNYPNSNRRHSVGGYFNGKRHGEWTYFDESGNESRIEKWSDGIRSR